MRTYVHTLVVAALTTTCCSAQFIEVSLGDGFTQAREQDRLLFVHATAEWCLPCKKMERETYSDDRVKQWLTEYAVALKVDVEERPTEAQELRIRSMPTVIVFRDGKEFDRSSGYQGPDQLLGWLESIRAGKSSLEIATELADL